MSKKRSSSRQVEAAAAVLHIPAVPITDPKEAARAAHLRYTTDDRPGIRRLRSGKGFRYFDASNNLVRDEEVLERIRSLAIPPAWENVWICPVPSGHLQATGRDARGRKQYRYHTRWRAIRDETKYSRLLHFAEALPRIRARVGRDLAKEGLPKEKVVAAVVRLLELTRIRVGNEEYAKENHTFGLTTLRSSHVVVGGGTIQFRFRGKSGVKHQIKVVDRRVARVVARCQDLPGQELFQYIAGDEELRSIDSADVNDYLREATENDFTAKDFRTWSGTVLAAATLRELHVDESAQPTKKVLTQAVQMVAERLGNTVAVCRRCYIHPGVCEAYLEGTLAAMLQVDAAKGVAVPEGLEEAEQAIVHFLYKLI